MARRVVIGANSAGQVGIFVSAPGVDAYTASESQLRFSSSRRHLMLVQTGTVKLDSDPSTKARVNFAHPPGQVPFVLCGLFNPKPSTAPVKVMVDANGFDAYAAADPSGAYPAAGALVSYYAFLKSQ